MAKRRTGKFRDWGDLPAEAWVPLPRSMFKLNGSEIRTYAAIRSYQNWRTGKCCPSISTIARRAGLTEGTVKLARRKLRKLGYLDWHVPARKCYYWFPRTREGEDRRRSVLVLVE